MASPSSSRGAASQHPLRMAPGARSPPITSTAARAAKLLQKGEVRRQRAESEAVCVLPSALRLLPCVSLRLVLIDLKRRLAIHVAAVVAGGVGELGAAARRAAGVVRRPESRVGVPLARLAVLLDRKHDTTPAGNPRARRGSKATRAAGERSNVGPINEQRRAKPAVQQGSVR